MNVLSPILAATDLSPPSRHTVDRGFELAARLQAQYLVVHALEIGALNALSDLLGDQAGAVRTKLKDEAKRSLDRMLAEPGRKWPAPVQAEVLEGSPVDVILGEAERIDAGLLVLGARGESFLRNAVLGSTASRLLRKSSKRPLLVVKQPPHEGYRQVLVPVDFSPASHKSIQLARLLAPGAEIVLFHAFELPYEGKLVFAGVDDDLIRQFVQTASEERRKQLHRLAKEAALGAEEYFAVVKHGEASQQIVTAEQERDIDLIVIGKRGTHLAEELLLGSVTAHVLGEAQCDVAVIGDAWQLPSH